MQRSRKQFERKRPIIGDGYSTIGQSWTSPGAGYTPLPSNQYGEGWSDAHYHAAKGLFGFGRSNQYGEGFWGDVWDGIKSGANAVNKFAKDTKIISTGLGFIPGIGGAVAKTIASQTGYGKKRGKKSGVRRGVLRF